MSRNFLQVFEAKDYSGEAGGNPLFPHRSRRLPGLIKWLCLGLFLLGFITVTGWIIYGPKWRINDMTISGLVTISEDNVREAALNYLSGNYFFLPRNHRWFFSPGNLEDELLAIFPFRSVKTEIIGNTLSIIGTEQTTLLALYSGDNRILFDRSGTYVEVTNVPESLPLTIRTDELISFEIGHQIFSSDEVERLIAFDEGLRTRNITPLEYEIEKLIMPWFKVSSNLPYLIYFDVQQNIESQLTVLQAVIKEYDNNQPSEYIDVRFGDRAFVK